MVSVNHDIEYESSDSAGRRGLLTITQDGEVVQQQETPFLCTSYSFIPTNPVPWSDDLEITPDVGKTISGGFDVDAVLINLEDITQERVDIDDVDRAGGLHEFIDYDGFVLCDTGGYLRAKYEEHSGHGFDDYMAEAREDAEEVAGYYEITQPDLFASPDISLKPPNIGESIDKVPEYARNRRLHFTLEALDHLLDLENTSGIVPVVSGFDFNTIDKVVTRIRQIEEKHDTYFPVVGVGSLEPITSWYVRNLNYKTSMFTSITAYVRQQLPDRHLHAFGVSSPMYISLLSYLGYDSFEAISWIQNARRFKVFSPETGIESFTRRGREHGEETSSGESEGVASEVDWDEIADCGCPSCTAQGNDIETIRAVYQDDGDQAFAARAVHNAWVCQQKMEDIRAAIRDDELKVYVQDKVLGNVPTIQREGMDPVRFHQEFYEPLLEGRLPE